MCWRQDKGWLQGDGAAGGAVRGRQAKGGEKEREKQREKGEGKKRNKGTEKEAEKQKEGDSEKEKLRQKLRDTEKGKTNKKLLRENQEERKCQRGDIGGTTGKEVEGPWARRGVTCKLGRPQTWAGMGLCLLRPGDSAAGPVIPSLPGQRQPSSLTWGEDRAPPSCWGWWESVSLPSSGRALPPVVSAQ